MPERRTMAMHQPNYIPWIGYFYKMLRADVFVYLDAVQYPRGRSFSARNRIKTPDGTPYLSVPVSVPSGQDGKATYAEVSFADAKWRKKHLRTLEMSYRKAPHFDEIHALVEPPISSADSLLELNVELVERIADYLHIDTERMRLSELLEEFGEKSRLIVDISRAVGATHYLSGTGGGHDYNDEKQLADAGIELVYSDFEHPVYTQLWGEFEANLSVLDLLFNHGPESRAILESGGSAAN